MDLLSRTAINRARSALELAAPRDHTEALPLSTLLSRQLGGLVEIPDSVERQQAALRKARGWHSVRGDSILIDPAEFLFRDITTSLATATSKGGNLVGNQRPGLIHELGDTLSVVAAGARVVTFQESSSLPYLTAGATANWVSEGSAPTEAAPAFGLHTLAPKTVIAYLDVSRRLRLMASAQLDAELEAALRRAIARMVDEAALGVGVSNSPVGILGTSGITAGTLGSGGVFSRATASGMFKEIAADGALDAESRLAWITAPDVAAKLHRTEAASGSGWLFEPSSNNRGKIAGFETFVTGACPDGAAILGDWNKLTIAFFGPVEVLVDRVTNSREGALRLVAYADVAVALNHPEGFAAVTGVSVS